LQGSPERMHSTKHQNGPRKVLRPVWLLHRLILPAERNLCPVGVILIFYLGNTQTDKLSRHKSWKDGPFQAGGLVWGGAAQVLCWKVIVGNQYNFNHRRLHPQPLRQVRNRSRYGILELARRQEEWRSYKGHNSVSDRRDVWDWCR